MSSAWHFGNTTVRNPQRIREGLLVLQNSGLSGNLIGPIQERLFADALDHAGVVTITNKSRDYSDMGRKWRSCFSQLGFITHKFSRSVGANEVDGVIREVQTEYIFSDLTGRSYEITPSGHRMIKAETVQQQNECMLRALLAYQIPSVIEPKNGTTSFSPFLYILQVLSRLNELQDNRGLSKVEMGLVQVCRDHDEVDLVIQQIIKFRSKYDQAEGRVGKRKQERLLLEGIATSVGVNWESLKDYADVNFRYPRLTGLVSLKSKRLVLNQNKVPIVKAILTNPQLIDSSNQNLYLMRLWNGAELPTDNSINATNEINRFKHILLDAGFSEQDLPSVSKSLEVAELNLIRMQFEEMYQLYLEEKFATDQAESDQVKEIIAYLKKLDKQKIPDEFDIEIDDEPSYLEWAVWRAFLAINNIINKPHKARRFKVDQDFFPISCASGGGADMIFEFEDFVLVVEVTLTTSSRQEAAEGEPVRRHVAKEKINYQQTDKPVYGLFLARSIDNNTAETFRIGVWYRGDEPDFINIVPLTLSQFISIMEKFECNRFENQQFRKLLDGCLIPRNAHAPAWKREIEKTVLSFVN
ncbi:AlwI family type II restriction endonuclease [Schinkia azotoformans]|uniref:AlwI family type II restriction endonuclease n=1 Tax=Schinkia azotoformans TaxID=1454 RepID=UPI002DBAE9EF|nr:AlwI family type II restriction endonuclease [Schinkia azotoformans]MEC1716985.1 AlwI family type II restriction endonuclease [Schinkia azotoformans]MEC1743268.1 AlwI family type II restriction endonuclease [Schinkia azotoformans]MEC1744845.1 AlwI family type II restriction endonuclease [Schinkia azotoformans]MEC1757025.1 AlwI family type II restriction endonuclease [Schinkia azotoformans]MEC1767020.1 AlwI family type II restriction endonuclease [Schinkia azotoformans]